MIAQEARSQSITLSGFVRDAITGEDLIGANVFVTRLGKGVSSNNYGYYSISVDTGQYTFEASYIGYEQQTLILKLAKDKKKDIVLWPKKEITEEVVIRAEKSDKNISSTALGAISIPVKQIKQLSGVLGEVDVLKTIQLLPGVQSVSEGGSGFYVRGGGVDQNLILLDGANVYNTSHLFGFLSVFNSDAIKGLSLIKGGIPAKYGGRLSSVLDISMKEGNMKEFSGEGGMGIVASRITLEGPVKKDTCSFMVSARRTYVDVLVKPLASPFVGETSDVHGSNYYFYDLNAKINYRISKRDRLFLSSYFGRDVFTYQNKERDYYMQIPWGNVTASLRWNHLFGDKLFVNTMAVFSKYQFDVDLSQKRTALNVSSTITDYSLKSDFCYFPNIDHQMDFGVHYTRHVYLPNSMSDSESQNERAESHMHQHAHEAAVYFQEDYHVNKWLRLNFGLRGNMFAQVGPFNRYKKDEEDNIVDTLSYKKGEQVVRFSNVEPRLALRIKLNQSSSIKLAYTHNYQYIHLASLASVTMPTDLWVPCSDVVKPQFAVQYTLGYYRNMLGNLIELSTELYYKKLSHQLEYKPNTTIGDNIGDNPDNNFTFGNGQSYGIELFVKKAHGRTTGWLGYTLSKTTRQFELINNGETFPAKYDRRHDLSLTITHELNKRWTASAIFVFANGSRFTLVEGWYLMDNANFITEYGSYNAYQMKAYHRMDVSLTYTLRERKYYSSTLNFAIYNVYNRHNPYFIYFDIDGDVVSGQASTVARQVTVFPIIPSVAWNFKF